MIEILEQKGLDFVFDTFPHIRPLVVTKLLMGGCKIVITPYYTPRGIVVHEIDKDTLKIDINTLLEVYIVVRGEGPYVVRKEEKKLELYSVIIILGEA